MRERAPAKEPADVDDLCATIVPEDPWARDVYMPGICCIVDHSEPTGLQRGVGLLPGTPPLAPDGQRIVMLCTGFTTKSKKIARFQCRYSLMLHQAGGDSCTLMGHPKRNGWTLMNEPPKGVRANCSFYIASEPLELTAWHNRFRQHISILWGNLQRQYFINIALELRHQRHIII